MNMRDPYAVTRQKRFSLGHLHLQLHQFSDSAVAAQCQNYMSLIVHFKLDIRDDKGVNIRIIDFASINIW